MSVTEEFRKIVIKRLEAMPENVRVSMGSMGTFSRDELIKNVSEDTAMGKFILEMQIKYMQSMRRGFKDEQNISNYQAAA